MSRRSLALVFLPLGLLLSTGCGREDGQSLRNIRRWEDTRSIPPDSLETLLRDGEVTVRAAAARAAGRVGDPVVLEALADRLLKDDAATVRAEAAFALGILGDPAAGPVLARAMERESDAEALGEIVLAVGRLDLEEATPQLLPLLNEGHVHVQEQCLEALALLADSTSIDPLIAATDSPLESVRWRAAYALEKLPGQIDLSADRLRRLLDDPSSLVRRYAIRAFGRTGYDAAAGDIAACLRQSPDDWQLWSMGCDALGRLGDAHASDILRDALAHPSFHVRTGALIAAGQRKERELLPELLDQCKHPSVGVRAAAYDAVGACLEGRATSELLVGLDDDSSIVAAACARRLGECDDDRAMVTLLELIRDDEEPMLRAAATEGLGRAGERAPIPVLRALASDEDWVVATLAIDALGTLEVTDAVPELLAQYDARTGAGRNDVCWQILQSFQRLGDSAVIPLCRRALDSESDVRLRLAAAAALRELLDEAEAAAIPSDEAIRRDVRPVRRSPKQAPLVVTSDARRLILDTDRGTIEIELLGAEAPQMVESFATLAEEGFFDGLSFHRVVPNFVIQGGDPLGTGWGDPGFTLRSEWNPLRYERGTVGIAHSGKDTGGCQLFITQSPQPHLNARYTIFGHVIAGMDVVDRIERGDRFNARVRRSTES